jgi:hypothetical protein
MVGQPLTSFPELDFVLRDHEDRLRQALGDLIVAVYLQGSLAIGDFDLTSDVDFIVVTRRELSLRNPMNSATQSGGFRPPSESVGGRGATDAVVSGCPLLTSFRSS